MRPDEIIPIYIVAGFLDSGKTSLIQNMLEDDSFGKLLAEMLLDDTGLVKITAEPSYTREKCLAITSGTPSALAVANATGIPLVSMVKTKSGSVA